MKTLLEIAKLTEKYAASRDVLAAKVTALNTELDALVKKQLPDIKALVARVAGQHAVLEAALEESAPLFAAPHPRTVVFADVKVGYRKGAGGIDWDDDDTVVRLIEKHFTAAQAELLIKTTKRPIAKAIEDLDISDLKKIGCRVEDTGDQVVIRPVDGDVEKTVKLLLKSFTEDTNHQPGHD